MTNKRQWQASAIALAAAALLSVPSSPAHALALGRVSVQSALGEPLRAEIDVPEITADEAASLRTRIAAPETFRAAGLEFSPAVSGINVSLQRRGDGRYFLRLASDRPVNEPFVDVLLETSWASGRIVRDFTMLFDPPSMRQGQPLTAQVTPSPAPAGRAVPTPVAPQRSTRPATPSTAAPAPAAAQAPSTTPAPTGEGRQVTVQSGDTAGKIAAANKPNTVSLDQMLVAMLRANPDAFIEGNVNRLRAGTVLNVPTEEQAQAVSASEASQTVVAQSRDFNEFRRRLAEGLPTAPAAGTAREASGRVQAQVDDKRPAADAPDKLTLSKGAVQGRGTEDKIAQTRASQEAANRVAELNRNISELNKLTGSVPAGTGSTPAAGSTGSSASTGAAANGSRPATTPAVPSLTLPAGTTAAATTAPAAAAAATPAQAPASATPAATPAVASASAPVQADAAAPAATTATAPADAASAPAADTGTAAATAAASPAPAAAAPTRPAPPPVVEEPSLVDELVGNPLVPAALGGVLALLLGLGAWRMRQRKKSAQIDSSFLESRLQPDSFFGASGGQRVDTAEGPPTGSSMVYSPSQLDAAGDVDPVAEADVYLAYGRDLQAEEILKEALRINPQRIAIHTKLLEIYAKRRDAKAFEHLAGEAFSLTRGEGPEWSHIRDLGQELDASNPMYQPGGQPSGGGAPSRAAVAGTAAAGAAAASMAATRPIPAQAPETPDSVSSSIDLDLDFSLDDAPAAPPTASVQAPKIEAPADPMPSLDFGAVTAPAPAEAPVAKLEAPELTLPDNGLNFDATDPGELPGSPAAAPAPVAAAADAGMIEFDLGSLSLDLPGTPAAAPAEPRIADAGESLSTAGLELDAGGNEDPLATKLALAQEFNAIGDADGARSLAQEVIAEASGDLRNRAQKFLAEIG